MMMGGQITILYSEPRAVAAMVDTTVFPVPTSYHNANLPEDTASAASSTCSFAGVKGSDSEEIARSTASKGGNSLYVMP
jgi:hypothetical protein